MRVAITTLGCKVNQYESRALEEALEARGHVIVSFGEPADAVVVNSCAVTHRSDRDTRALARRARKSNPGARLVVTGCGAQMDPEALRGLGAELVVGNGEKSSIPDILTRGLSGVWVGDVAQARRLEPEPVRSFGSRSRAFLKVQDGCQCFCAYCVVPYARGPSRSLSLEEVREGLKRIRSSGHREVVLTGIHLGLWGRDLLPPAAFSGLLDDAEACGIPRVRLSSLEPGELTPEVIRRIAGSRTLCPHLHIPLQSGSDRILAAMGRPYTGSEFRDRVGAALEAVPDLCLGLDVIAGFSGEEESDFEETRRLLEALPLAYLHVFPFSPRPGTRAFDMPGRVSEGVLRERASALRDLSRRKRREYHAAQLGRVLPALAEGAAEGGFLTARTRNYVPVRMPWAGPEPVDEIRVEIVGLEAGVVHGRLAAQGGG